MYSDEIFLHTHCIRDDIRIRQEEYSNESGGQEFT